MSTTRFTTATSLLPTTSNLTQRNDTSNIVWSSLSTTVLSPYCMFGESESESPRTGSPWDGFLSRSASDLASPAVETVLTKSPRVVPKLIPEVEEGNVEYKLRLLNPSAERFTRLVTQLKWRLLEGGGQAYYELGVADSGQLVGLSRSHLAQSLQTLEEMAGEIGASVIVVKEIEIPAALLDVCKSDDPRGKIADGAMRMHKVRVADYVETPPSSAGGDEEELELSSMEIEEESYSSPGAQFSRRSSTFEDEAYDSTSGDDGGMFTADLEIASVYKPRPHRRRTPTPSPTPPKPPRASFTSSDAMFELDLNALHVHSTPMDVPPSDHTHSARKTEKWKRKELKRTLRMQVPRLIVDGEGQSDGDSEPASASAGSRIDTVGTNGHVKALDDLEAAAAILSFNDGPSPASLPSFSEAASDSPIVDDIVADCNDVMHKGVLLPDDPTVHRFIVEALVVRKMSIEEAFLDFVNI